MIQTPILLLVFNRPEITRALLQSLAAHQPRKLYIGADGPRSLKEKILTNEVRHQVETVITWPCEVHKNYRSENLGLRKAVSQAIHWFFAHEEAGIILEDDCMPDASFLVFAEAMLDRYKSEKRVMHISGNNLLPGGTSSFHFSKYPRVWGWATWKRAWAHYDDSEEFVSKLTNAQLKQLYPRKIDRAFWQLIVEKMNLPTSTLRDRSWAYFWALNVRFSDGLCVQPDQNLIRNVGFGESATNTSGVNRLEALSASEQKVLQIETDTQVPIEINEQHDNRYMNKILIHSRWSYLKVWLKSMFPFLKPRR